MYVYLSNLHTLWKLKSSYKDEALDPIFGNSPQTSIVDACSGVGLSLYW
jgi:hypothetical protein